MNATDRGPHDHRIVISRFVEACRADDRIVAAFLYGSHARGEADEYSDLDLCLIATDEDYEDVSAGRAAIIDRLGQPLFLEDFGLEGIVFSILSGGTDVELLLGRESRFDEIHVGSYLTLLDKKGILAGAEFPSQDPDRAEQMEALHRALVWFWHELSHFIAAVGRGQLWWAYGQLEALRSLCVNLVRIEQHVQAQEEAYEKLDQVLPTAGLSALRSTFVPMERRAMLRAVADIVGFYRERAPVVATAYGLTYPTELERQLCDRLDDLARATG